MSDPRDRPKAAATTELETADLLQLAQRGTVEVAPRANPEVPATGPKVVVDLAPTPPQTPRATVRPPPPSRGLVLLVYAIAIAALAASIYARWLR